MLIIRNILLTSVLLGLVACSDPKKEEKNLENRVMALHEKVMGDGEKAMQNKMEMDTLMMRRDSLKKADPALDTVAAMQKMKTLNTKIIAADNEMSDWMHNYNPEFTGKSHDQVMEYLTKQKNQIEGINTKYNKVIDESNDYLSKFNKK